MTECGSSPLLLGCLGESSIALYSDLVMPFRGEVYTHTPICDYLRIVRGLESTVFRKVDDR